MGVHAGGAGRIRPAGGKSDGADPLERARVPVKSRPSRITRVCCGSFYTSGNGLASWDRRTRRLTLYSFKDREPPASQLSGVAGIHEDADGNLWLATYGSGLVRVDPSRRSAVRYRHSPLDPDSISDDMLGVGV